MVVKTFAIEEPDTIDEVLEMLADDEDGVRLIAGGTGLTPLIRNGFFAPTTLVSLRRVAPQLSGLSDAGNGELRLGAMVTLRTIEQTSWISHQVPAMQQALRSLGTVRLRNVATVGGALAFAHPQMDLPPLLLALDARIRVRSGEGERWIEAADFFRGIYEAAIEDRELIIELALPALANHRGLYRKVTARTVDDWPVLGIAVVARLEESHVRDIRVALGALSDRAQRLPDLENALSAVAPTLKRIRSAADDAADSIEYHDGPTTTARYQRQLVKVHLRRALETVLLGS